MSQNFQKTVPAGTVVHMGTLPGVVVRTMRRIPASYVIWGTADLPTAQQWERNNIRPAIFYRHEQIGA